MDLNPPVQRPKASFMQEYWQAELGNAWLMQVLTKKNSNRHTPDKLDWTSTAMVAIEASNQGQIVSNDFMSESTQS